MYIFTIDPIPGVGEKHKFQRFRGKNMHPFFYDEMTILQRYYLIVDDMPFVTIVIFQGENIFYLPPM